MGNITSSKDYFPTDLSFNHKFTVIIASQPITCAGIYTFSTKKDSKKKFQPNSPPKTQTTELKKSSSTSTLLVMVKVQALVHFLVVMFTLRSELTWIFTKSRFCTNYTQSQNTRALQQKTEVCASAIFVYLSSVGNNYICFWKKIENLLQSDKICFNVKNSPQLEPCVTFSIKLWSKKSCCAVC